MYLHILLNPNHLSLVWRHRHEKGSSKLQANIYMYFALERTASPEFIDRDFAHTHLDILLHKWHRLTIQKNRFVQQSFDRVS